MTARLNAADAGMTEAYGLKIIAAVVVGGSSLLGGEGGVERTFLGALVLTIISNLMNIEGIVSEWQNLVFGIVILAIGGLDFARHRI
jgi:ribose/xylose/arabinose/galactoside ABC-type transport system permease subunit